MQMGMHMDDVISFFSNFFLGCGGDFSSVRHCFSASFQVGAYYGLLMIIYKELCVVMDIGHYSSCVSKIKNSKS
ncbi:hypothetical protein EYC80_003212 [Monilinia laxa]|uniref:Uncharacterized protein n=1 Tax=Monilinia laxa TaxID=61186 RepID=A0A5N6KD41_MONLA|nr:hypothetical protein EYC80_003212 [Monilinia laxa]